MKLFYYILLLLYSSFLLSEEVEIIVLSETFTIDTIDPEIEILSPSHGDSYSHQDVIEVIWDASDQSPANNPMSIYVSGNLDNPYVELFSNFDNTGYLQVNVPTFINTLFASVRLEIVDFYGNTSSVYSSGYFILGNPNISNYEVSHEDITTEITSASFEIDTKDPVVTWIFPNQSSSFNPGQGQIVRWQAEDDNMRTNPITLLFVDSAQESYVLSDSAANNGIKFIQIPNASIALGYFKALVTDEYGNIGYDLSDEYMSIGEEFSIEIEEETITDTLISQSFTVDTKPPEFNMITDSSFFYPSGGETLTQYNNIALNWDCRDDSYEDMNIVVSLAYLLGGWYSVIDTFPGESIYNNTADLSFNGIVDNSIWGRLIFEAIDDYGNSTEKYNDDYFVLGSSDGDIGAELYDEDNLEMFVSWTWENKKHRIAIAPSALEFLNVGDLIDIIDENGIIDNDCESESGSISVGSNVIQYSEQYNRNYLSPIQMSIGVDHCTIGSGGGRMPGYVLGDSLRIRITTTADSSYYLRPSLYRGSLTFNNKNTVIKEFNTTPYQLNSINPDPFLSIDEREIDNFNVYSKVTNHTGGLNRDITCDNDGVCDSSELVEYYNDVDCVAGGYQWDAIESVCYFDHNGSGDYSPEEVDENVADCYSDCCSVQSDDDWCFIDMVTDEEFNHSLVSSNYLPSNTSSATVSYKVYALDQNYNEIYQAVSEDAEITLGSDDISSISLGSGWNWFSLNRNISDMGVNSVFSQFLDEDWQCEYGGADTNCPYYIKSQDAYGIFYAGYGFYPEFTMEIESFYKLQMNAESELWYGGSIVDPSSMPLALNTGWNWVGYLTPNSLSINSALSGIINNNSPAYAKSQSGFAIFYEDFGFYPEFIMDVNGGYMLQMNAVDTLTYPSGALYSDNNIVSDINESIMNWSINYRDFEFSTTATIEIDMNHLKVSDKDQLAVFSGNQCHGVAKAEICPINDKILFSLMYYSNEKEMQDLDIKYYNSNSNKFYDIREKLNFVSDENFGDVFSPIVIHDILAPVEYKLDDPYPNPFNPVASIDFQLPQNVDYLQLSIYDIRGRLVETLHNGPMNFGYHKYKWNADNFSSGIYFVNMVTNKQKFTKKITLLK